MKGSRMGEGWMMHLFFITLFLVLPILSFVRPPGEPFTALTRVFIQDSIANLVLLVFFYFNYYYFIPRFYFANRYLAYLFLVLVFLASAFALPHLVANRLLHLPDRNFLQSDHAGVPDSQPGSSPGLGVLIFDEFRRHLYLFFTALFFSFLLRTRENLARVSEEKLQAELTALKSRINPHFLFNTLNSIYALALRQDKSLPTSIMNLSGLMRYVTKDAHEYRIPLEKELEYLQNFVELQKTRLAGTVSVQFEVSGDPAGLEVAPLVLITYIENAFKYGVNPDTTGCVVEISIRIQGRTLEMEVYNKKVGVVSREQVTGFGMQNTRERLQHLYPGKHELIVQDSEQDFKVNIKIEMA